MQNCDECLPPRVEQTQGGDTVFYQNRYLYSKRQPRKQIETVIASLFPSERTLFLFASPTLGYGAIQMVDVLPASSFLFFIECDEQLGNLFEKSFWKEFISSNTKKNIKYVCTRDVQEAIKQIEIQTGFNFKRIEIIRGSAGFSLNENFYLGLLHLLEIEMNTFWKNRVTLIEMARLYSRNIFKWLHHILENTQRFKVLPHNKIEKPILLLGAGPSLDESLDFIRENRDDFFLIAVDVVLPTLSSIEVEPDAVVLLEGQYWIENAFLLSKYRKVPLFASITSNPHVFNILQGKIFLYSIEFAPMQFLHNLNKTLPYIHSFNPLGSVGLQALQLALFISKPNIPIFHTGLDFSYSQGFTHATSSMHPYHITMQCSRLQGLYQGGIFPVGCCKTHGKNESVLWTTPTLTSYASIYKREFVHCKNIFDIGKSGLILQNSVLKENDAKTMLKSLRQERSRNSISDYIENTESLKTQSIKCFLDEEKKKLINIKNILIGLEDWDAETFINIVKSTDYLYLHFPDYPTLNNEFMTCPSFLKRIRIETEYFLKIIE